MIEQLRTDGYEVLCAEETSPSSLNHLIQRRARCRSVGLNVPREVLPVPVELDVLPPVEEDDPVAVAAEDVELLPVPEDVEAEVAVDELEPVVAVEDVELVVEMLLEVQGVLGMGVARRVALMSPATTLFQADCTA